MCSDTTTDLHTAMGQYTCPLAACPRRDFAGAAGHDGADQAVDDLVDRGPIGTVGHLLAQTDDDVVAVALMGVVRSISLADFGARREPLEAAATDPRRS